MKKLFILLPFLLAFTVLPSISHGQNKNEDAVYLKNGKIIHGVIIDQVANQSLKIQTSDNKVLTFKITEIEKISKVEGTLYKKKEDAPGKGFSLGVKAGMDISTISNLVVDDPVSKESKLGFQGGLIGKYGFNKLLAVQMELLFTQKGYKVEATQNGNTTKHFLRINYLEIPLMAKVTYPLGKFVVFGNVGPYLGVGLNGLEGDIPDAGINQPIYYGEGGYQNIDFGFAFGAGFGYKIGIGEIILDLRYDLGLSDIHNVSSSTKNTSGYVKNSNRNFGIALGFLMPLGSR